MLADGDEAEDPELAAAIQESLETEEEASLRRAMEASRAEAAAPRVSEAAVVDVPSAEAPEPEPVGARPSADRDVGADTVEHHAADPAAPSLPVAAESTVDTMAAVAESLPEQAAPAEPDRPKRSGWWQRAKSSFGSA